MEARVKTETKQKQGETRESQCAQMSEHVKALRMVKINPAPSTTTGFIARV